MILKPLSGADQGGLLISRCLSLQRLGAGLGFPARDWVWVAVVKAPSPSHGPVVSDKGPGPLTLQKRLSTKMESSEASKVFIRRKKSTVCVDRHTSGLTGRVPEFLSHALVAV